MQTKGLHPLLNRDILSKRYQLARDARLVCKLNQVLPTFGLFDFFCARQQRVHVAIFLDKQRGGFHPNARNARNIVGAITCKGLHVNDLIGAHPELLFHFS